MVLGPTSHRPQRLSTGASCRWVKPVRSALDALAAQRTTPDTVPADALAALQSAATDYDFDRLAQYARSLLEFQPSGTEAHHDRQPETSPP